jgi:hypothetical protein
VQQPLGHVVESHTHWPEFWSHLWPLAHAAQALPAAPHAALLSEEYATHTVPLQQPVEQDPPPHVQAPLLHAWPVPQVPQAWPPVPHCEVDCAVTQTLPLQQPVGQDVESQMHAPVPVLHRCPLAQAAHEAAATPHDAPVSLA